MFDAFYSCNEMNLRVDIQRKLILKEWIMKRGCYIPDRDQPECEFVRLAIVFIMQIL